MTNWTDFQNFDELWQGLLTERQKRKGMLKTPTVTTSHQHKPQARTMVLREFLSTPYPTLVFFTDIRSPKVAQIKSNPQITIHSYSPRTRTQLQFYTTGHITRKHPRFQQWRSQGLQRKEDYATVASPSQPTDQLADVTYNLDLAGDNFAVMLCQIQSVEILALGQPHQRCLWNYQNQAWTKQWLIP